MSGAASGAMVGTYVMPGVGTAVGAVVGGLLGSLLDSSEEEEAARRRERARQMELDFNKERGLAGAKAQRLAMMATSKRTFGDKEKRSDGSAPSALSAIADSSALGAPSASDVSGTF